MKVNEAIMAADMLRPNAFDDEKKTRWLSELDGKIAFEVFKSENKPQYDYSRDGETELFVKEPHSSIYTLWLVAMIDFYNRDIESYENTLLMFNAEYDVFAKWYQRNNVSKSSGEFKNYF